MASFRCTGSGRLNLPVNTTNKTVLATQLCRRNKDDDFNLNFLMRIQHLLGACTTKGRTLLFIWHRCHVLGRLIYDLHEKKDVPIYMTPMPCIGPSYLYLARTLDVPIFVLGRLIYDLHDQRTFLFLYWAALFMTARPKDVPIRITPMPCIGN